MKKILLITGFWVFCLGLMATARPARETSASTMVEKLNPKALLTQSSGIYWGESVQPSHQRQSTFLNPREIIINKDGQARLYVDGDDVTKVYQAAAEAGLSFGFQQKFEQTRSRYEPYFPISGRETPRPLK